MHTWTEKGFDSVGGDDSGVHAQQRTRQQYLHAREMQSQTPVHVIWQEMHKSTESSKVWLKEEKESWKEREQEREKEKNERDEGMIAPLSPTFLFQYSDKRHEEMCVSDDVDIQSQVREQLGLSSSFFVCWSTGSG